jgi:gamma-glutamyltranspeptidase/glutathione hydrolase
MLAACASDEEPQSDPAATCADVPNGTPIAKAPPPPGPAPTTQNLATNPEIATVYRSGMVPVNTASYAVSTANPVSTQAACEVLRDGGTAADALIVAQTVLGLVEPQSSGIGGGAFLLYYDAGQKSVEAYDGREVAPMAATENYLRWISDTDRTEPKPDARASGRSIGVPGVVRMLELAHREHGRDEWRELFDPAISLADQGLEISPRMAGQIAESAPDLALDEPSKAYFLNPDGSPKPAGTKLTNPAMAKTLGAIAAGGADAFYTGAIAQGIVDAAARAWGGRREPQVGRDGRC